ncbi:MAG: dTDP-4-dehydrorhamnose 3,5-epimerase family protein [Bdellovibrionota bacterium]|nr:MAG: dTDP-4-dehydrorhamnose 3,5-epimerase family protein [Bdellovibrionota bacterium]
MAHPSISSVDTPCVPKDNEIVGVWLKQLRTFPDDRGFFREIVRATDPFFVTDSGKAAFQQWSHSCMSQNVVKAWHYHHVQHDWWYIAVGQIETVLFDNRPESPTYKRKLVFRMGESLPHSTAASVCVRIPPGVLHALKVLSPIAHLFYITSEIYNQNEEGRFPYNSSLVGHDWGSEVIVADNDTRTFEPTSSRIPMDKCSLYSELR